MKIKTVVITGATSFTGLWIAYAFHQAGFRVFGTCAHSGAHYQGLARARFDFLRSFAQVVENCKSHDGSMAQWAALEKIDLWVHHHHPMENYRKPDYDLQRSQQEAVEPLHDLLKSIKKSGVRGIIYSGTIFEPHYQNKDILEGTPYAQSKQIVWEKLRELCLAERFNLSKVVISDPIGPYENLDRLIPLAICKAKNKEVMFLRASKSIFDRIPARALAESYVPVAEGLLEGASGEFRPSGFVGTNAAFLKKVNDEFIVGTLKLPPLVIEDQGAQDPIQVYCNSSAVTVAWPEFWREYQELGKNYSLTSF